MNLSDYDLKFSVRHLRDGGFTNTGLRDYARYRDLGLVESTDGAVQAHVIRPTPPCTDAVRQRHCHDHILSIVYLLNGWIKLQIDGNDEVRLEQGSCMTLPGGTGHTVLDYSDDCEVLEINLPAEFETIPL